MALDSVASRNVFAIEELSIHSGPRDLLQRLLRKEHSMTTATSAWIMSLHVVVNLVIEVKLCEREMD